MYFPRCRNPNGRCEIPGVGVIPKTVMERLACDSEIFGHVFDRRGVSLWHGRGVRTVSPQQWRALLARDRGCVLCGSHPGFCEAHHIVEWLDGGPTDIENLALLCTKHHHAVHDQNQRLVRAGPRSWHTRPKPTTGTRPPRSAPTRAGPKRRSRTSPDPALK